MISFFRKIRQKLLAENRVTRYLIYAIGEIFLVVIGILIALQVNNWNENRKAVLFEKEILSLIDQNLERDVGLLSEELQKAKQAIALTDRLLLSVSLNLIDDSLNHWMGKIISFERFRSQASAFEVLKARGVGSIRDKELQLALISYYDVNVYEVDQSLEDVEFAFNTDWIPVIKENFVTFKWMDYHQPVDSKVFFENPSHLVLFRMFKDNREGTVRNIESALQKIEEIRNQIDKQLK
jgi:hypothetical protein